MVLTSSKGEAWPELPLDEWSDTYAGLHLWLQIVGKIRLKLSPWVNHSWNATLYPTASGLTTSPITYQLAAFQIDFDFQRHRLMVSASDGRQRSLPLQPQSVAAFYRSLMNVLAELGITVRIHMKPNEVADPVRFDEDDRPRPYDAEYTNRFWRALLHSQRVLSVFRARFIGKCSPVHLFWGAPDIAVTRFSGRTAPPHPGGVPNLPDRISREAYSHEVSSAGFWAGGGAIQYPAFYSYAYPTPAGFSEAAVEPAEAFYSQDLGEFILPYDAVRRSATPDETLLRFLQSTYVAAADGGGWDRHALERTFTPYHTGGVTT